MSNETGKVTRKLRAILSADVKGYSLLMADDEVFTIRTLIEYREIMSDLIQQHSGRVVDNPGDNLLAEFSSAVDAVEAAVAIQKKLKKENAKFVENKRLQFRIGVNIGDVVHDGDRIYGSGVNVAARIEGLADAGGICISRGTYDQIKGKIDLETEYLGEQEVKNINEPVRVYRVLMDKKMAEPEFEPAKVEEMLYPLPEKPSIAVLPFVNMSGDPEQEYIGDSVAENIITALSYVTDIFVIARTSTSFYKGKSVKIKQISEELGVRYVLEGSIQKSEGRLRVTAQLIDAISGHHLWANRYDRKIEDFFKVLDEIAKVVVIELQVNLTEGDISRLTHKTKNFEAWLSAITAYSYLKDTTPEAITNARELFEKAVNLDPEYGFAWGGLGAAHNVEGRMGWSESPGNSFKMAGEYTEKALRLDENLSCATSVKGGLYRTQGQFDKAIATGKKATALGPSHDLPCAILSDTLHYAGSYEESIVTMKKAIRLNPYYPAWYLYVLNMNYFFLERYADAIKVGKRLLDRSQKGEFIPLYAHTYLSANYIELGQDEEAGIHAEQVIKIDPNFSLKSLTRYILQYKNKEDYARYIESLRKAGLAD